MGHAIAGNEGDGTQVGRSQERQDLLIPEPLGKQGVERVQNQS